jgi:predicted ABC-type ATPase
LPSLIVIGGPNGSGKTTLTRYLVQKGRIRSPIINPDEIAFEELGGSQHHIGAARLALQRRKDAIKLSQDIAFETTFSGQSEINEVKQAKANGYQLTLYFVALHSILDNLTRVQERKANRGHGVDNEDIVRRFDKSKQNLLNYITLFDRVYLFDNTANKRSRVAIFNHGKLGWLSSKHKEHPFFKGLF